MFAPWCCLCVKTRPFPLPPPPPRASIPADFNPDRWMQPDPVGSSGIEPQTSQTEAEAALGLKDQDSSSSSGGGCPFSSSSSSSSSNEDLHKPSGLLTFSVGPHACLGYSLFMAEAKVLLAVLARGYSAEPVHIETLNFKTKFLTLLNEGTVKFRQHEQPLPVSAREHLPRSMATAAAAAAVPQEEKEAVAA